MSFYKILVQPAKSSKGTCGACKQTIQGGTLRIQIADDREFKDYISRNGGRSQFQGEGMSRGGYIETQEGVISIKRYFVHLDCYVPVHQHPYEVEYFRRERFKPAHRDVFQTWLEKRQKEPPAVKQAIKKKKGKKYSDDEDYGKKKTKKINKPRRGKEE